MPSNTFTSVRNTVPANQAAPLPVLATLASVVSLLSFAVVLFIG